MILKLMACLCSLPFNILNQGWCYVVVQHVCVVRDIFLNFRWIGLYTYLGETRHSKMKVSLNATIQKDVK